MQSIGTTYSHDLARPRRTLQETQACSRQVSKKIKKSNKSKEKPFGPWPSLPSAVLVAVVVILVGYLLLFKKKSKVLKVPPTPTADEISPYPAKGAIAFRCASRCPSNEFHSRRNVARCEVRGDAVGA